ncbi:hypothetical protein [Nocardioides sp.]|uniref:hypothetical protein n=1 Tax=Nocardioides sp. TaxID=35761 RepID=UPI0035173514
MLPQILGVSTSQLVLWVLLGAVVLSVVAALLTRVLVQRGLRTPWVIRLVNRARDRAISLVKRPITIAVLDEVADVIQTGHYTKNISDAILENRLELKALVAEKVREDRSTRIVNKIPGFDTIVDEVSDTTLRVLVEMLGDPRMDELISDLLRNNIEQIKLAVRARQHETIGPPKPADPIPPPR